MPGWINQEYLKCIPAALHWLFCMTWLHQGSCVLSCPWSIVHPSQRGRETSGSCCTKRVIGLVASNSSRVTHRLHHPVECVVSQRNTRKPNVIFLLLKRFKIEDIAVGLLWTPAYMKSVQLHGAPHWVIGIFIVKHLFWLDLSPPVLFFECLLYYCRKKVATPHQKCNYWVSWWKKVKQ